MQNRIKLAKQLEKSAVPSSIVVTDGNNDQNYVAPGQDGEVLVSDGTSAAYGSVPISTDPNNSLTLGSDNKPFVPASSGGGFLSSLVDNGDGTYTHSDGDTPATTETIDTRFQLDSPLNVMNAAQNDTIFGNDVVSVTNGLHNQGKDIELGGDLEKNTTIDSNGFQFEINDNAKIEIGNNVTTTGNNAMGIGQNIEVKGASSLVVGENMSTTDGTLSLIVGNSNYNLGTRNIVSGQNSGSDPATTDNIVVGSSVQSKGNRNAVFGDQNAVNDTGTITDRNNNLVSGARNQLKGGNENTVIGAQNTVEGYRNLVGGQLNQVIHTTGNPDNNSVFGANNVINDANSMFVSGSNNDVGLPSGIAGQGFVIGNNQTYHSAQYSGMIGTNSTVTVTGAFTTGDSNDMTGNANYSFATGQNITVNEQVSFAYGEGHNIQDRNSYAGGRNNVNNGENSFTQGVSLESSSWGQIVIGEFNENTGGTQNTYQPAEKKFVMGNGDLIGNVRSNAYTITGDGVHDFNAGIRALTADPAGTAGMFYYNVSTNQFRAHDGTSWKTVNLV